MSLLTIPSLPQARRDHQSFIDSLRLRINGQADSPVNAAGLNQYAQGLGPWLYAYALVAYADVACLKDIETLHAGIYELAARAISCFEEPDPVQAKAVFGQLTELDKRLEIKLEELIRDIPQIGETHPDILPDDPVTGPQAILAKARPDITEPGQQQILMQQQQQALLDAIQVAQLGTWSMDVATRKTTFSQRHLEMFGVGAPDMDLKESISHVVESERPQLIKTFFNAIKPGSEGKFEAEYSIIHAGTGKTHIIHSKGQTNFDSSGNPVSISGIAQDVTMFRSQQQSLEALVELRTKELDASNKKLAEGNQKLQQANLLLLRSNEDLNRFAYVASHDLQEPLRKIQQFGSRLMAEFEMASPKGKDYLTRMSTAAERMSALITDLLTFSRVSTGDAPSELVSIRLIVERVISDLDVQISQANAVIEIGQLPDVPGNQTYLRQLFQNLVSNAIKFRKMDANGDFTPPAVKISSQKISNEDLPEALRTLAGTTSYYRIDVVDNGIGFNTIYLDRIFQVFQRLHGKSEYTGTGIGLAICERIVANMGGMITAVSSPGNGATFQVYLPDSK